MREIREGEYLDPADGLIHCGECGGPRQVVITNPFHHGRDIMRCPCSCQAEAERRREEARQRRQRMDRIRHRKAQGLQDRYLYDCTFAHDNGQNPVMAKAHAYVEHWPEAFKKNIGLLLFGDVGTGKSFLAGCIANALLDQDIPVLMTNFPTILARLSGARSICLDAYGADTAGKKYDMEVQREDKGADPHRARYHSSVLDVENLDAGQEFKQLPETYTIFITEKDVYSLGKPIYRIERINLDTGKPFEDGEHILYVNGEYRGDSDIGKLMHDFNCTDANDMNFELLAERTRYLKENPEGVEQMCKVIEDMLQENQKETMIAVAKRLLLEGTLTLEKIAECVGLPLDEVKKLQAEQGV